MTNFIFYLILAIADIWLFEFYLSKNLKLNKTKYKKFFYIIEILLMTCAYYVIQDSLILCAFLIVIITIISINKFQYSKKELLLSCTFFLIQYIIMRNIIIFTFIWIFDIPTLNTFLNWSLTYTILIEVAVHYLQFIIIIYLTKYKSKKVIVLHHFKSFSILLSFYFGIALVINNDKLFIFPNVGRTFIFVIIVYNVALIFFDRFQSHHEELEYDHEQLKSESSSDLVYFEEHLEGNEEIRSIKHDLDNHMIILSGYIESDNKVGALDYIKNIKKSIEIASATTHTGINSLDSVISNKIKTMKKENIKFVEKYKVISLGDIYDRDLALMLASALDNAIEAAVKSEDKVISLEMSTESNYVCIILTNSIKRNSKPNFRKSSKEDGARHGFGYKKIKKIVKKYNGNLDTEITKDRVIMTFTLSRE